MNRKRQINKPRPVSEVDMEAVFRQAKEEQEKNEKAFDEEQQQESLNSGMLNMDPNLDSNDAKESTLDAKPKGRSKKPSDPLTNSSSKGKGNKRFTPGSTVRVVSGTFAEFEGSLKKVNRKTGKVCDNTYKNEVGFREEEIRIGRNREKKRLSKLDVSQCQKLKFYYFKICFYRQSQSVIIKMRKSK